MLVRESIDFVRGMDPRTSMKIGLEVAIEENFRKLKKFDTDNLIDHMYVDGTYPYIYIYIHAKFFTGDFDWEDEKKIAEGKEILQKYFQVLVPKSGMDQYINFDSHDNIDEIVYKVKPAFRKTFYRISDNLNT